MGSAKTKGYTEALCVTHNHVGSQRALEQIEFGAAQCGAALSRVANRAVVFDECDLVAALDRLGQVALCGS